MVIEEKFILLKIVCERDENVFFKIKHQREMLRARMGTKHIHDTIRNNESYCKILSKYVPDIEEHKNIFWIRGRHHSHDNTELYCSKRFFKKIKRTIKNKVNYKNEILY